MAVMDNYNVQLRRKPEGLEIIIWSIEICQLLFFKGV